MAPTVCKLTQAGKAKTKVSIYLFKTPFPLSVYLRSALLTKPLTCFQMRKPVVEKMRRDRINRCIEQLKVLLKVEIKASQPCSKLEKADVLETAVIYLKNSTWPRASSPSAHAQSYADGFSRCIETARFLSVHNQQQITKPVLMGHFDGTQRAKVSAQDSCQIASKSTGEQALWRPWWSSASLWRRAENGLFSKVKHIIFIKCWCRQQLSCLREQALLHLCGDELHLHIVKSHHYVSVENNLLNEICNLSRC